MALFKKSASPIKSASNTVSTGSGNKGPDGSLLDDARSTVSSLWDSYGTWALIIAALFAAWKWLLPALGLRKKRRGNPGSLAKARRARAARRKGGI